MIEQWDAPELFFQPESQTDEVDCAGNIYRTMQTAGTKNMLLLLGYVLKKVNLMNIELQSQQFRLHKVFVAICDEYRCLLGIFVHGDIITSRELSAIDPLYTSVHKAIGDIELGGRRESMLVKQPLGDNEMVFRKDALSFLIQLCTQIRERFPFFASSMLAQLHEAVGSSQRTGNPTCYRPELYQAVYRTAGSLFS
jgi:hypothetical protein